MPFLCKASVKISRLSQWKLKIASAPFLSRGSYICLQHRTFQSSSREEEKKQEKKHTSEQKEKLLGMFRPKSSRGSQAVGLSALETYTKCQRESNSELQATSLQIKSILKMSHIQLPRNR